MNQTQPSVSTCTADAVIKYAENVAASRPQSDKYAIVAGVLQAFTRFLVDERDRLKCELASYSAPAKPAKGCQLAYVRLGDVEVQVEYYYEPPQRASYLDPAFEERCEITDVFVNGAWTRAADSFSDNQLERWQDEILEGLAADTAEWERDRDDERASALYL